MCLGPGTVLKAFTYMNFLSLQEKGGCYFILISYIKKSTLADVKQFAQDRTLNTRYTLASPKWLLINYHIFLCPGPFHSEPLGV